METRANGPQIAVFIDFENVAISAESDFGEFDLSAVMDLLRTRGRLLIKRAYGDWGRFHRYRRPMLENGVDLFQLYSVGVQQKNRADVRLAIDALETVFTRPNVDVYVIVSGDSDFTELIHKLRDHGKYTIGIALRSATSDLLRRACDEFIFYETLVAEEISDIADELQLPDPRELLRRALTMAEQKNELPVLVSRLKQIMLGLDSSFNEANYGFQQFRGFLEAHADLVALHEQGLQLYASLRKPEPHFTPEPRSLPAVAGPETPATVPQPPAMQPTLISPPPAPLKPSADLGPRYRSFLREAGLRVVEQATRQQVLADFLTTLQARPEPISLNTAADILKDRFDAENAMTPKIAVPDVARLLLTCGVLEFAGGQPGSDAPVRRAEALTAESLGRAGDAAYVWRLVEGGMPVYADQLTPVLYDAATDPARVTDLCKLLIERRLIMAAGDSYAVAPEQVAGLIGNAALAIPAADLAKVTLPPGEPISPATAERLFREGSDRRQKDFAGSSQRYLQAARIQLDARRAGQPYAGLDDLKWYLASYCSVRAGHAFVTGNFADAVPYYLAFFGLAQEADGVWPRIQRLVNPMSSYYFAIAGRRLNEAVPPNLGRLPAYQVALRIHNHTNTDVAQAWESLMDRLAEVNLGIVRQTYRELTGLIGPAGQQEAAHYAAAANENLARVERTRTFLRELIAKREA